MSDKDPGSKELLAYNRKFKKAVLDVMFNVCDTFYVHCMPNPDLSLGTRGLVDREKTEGMILVFGPYSTRHLSWDETFIFCEMQFSRWEKVTLPYECIARMFDKNGQVIMQWATLESAQIEPATSWKATAQKTAEPKAGKSESEEGDAPAKKGASSEKKSDAPRVIEVDFTKKKPKE